MNKDQNYKSQVLEILPGGYLVSVLFIIVYILQLGVMPLISQDEVRYAEIAREMIESGDWIVPRLNGIDYFEKPILGHWMNAISELLFGYNNFAVRFSSAFCTWASAIVLFLFLRTFSDNKKIALLVPVVFLTFGLVLAVGLFSVLDAQLSFFATTAMICFFLAYSTKKTTTNILYLILCGICAGFGFLTKGFLVFVVLAISIIPFLIWEKEWKKLLTMPWIPVLSMFIIILPWCVKVYYQAPDFWQYFVVMEHYNRFMHADKYSGALHPQPFWFLGLILSVGALPWFLHLPTIITGVKDKNILSNPLIKYCITWIMFPLIFFSASSGKLATYILPCFPPIAVLVVYGLYYALEHDKKTKIFDIINLMLGCFLIATLVASIVYTIASSFFGFTKLWDLRQLVLGVCALALWATVLFFIKKVPSSLHKLLLFAFAPILAMSLKSSLTPELALKNIAHEQFINEQSRYITKDTPVMAYQDMVGAVCWYLKRSDIYIYGKPGEFEHPLKKPIFQSRFIPKDRAVTFINEKKNNHEGVGIFLRTKNRKDIPIPSDIDVTKDKTMFLKFNPHTK